MVGTLLGIALIVFVLAACKKEPPNQYDELERGDPNPTVDALPTGNFAWIHQRILRPNCALSGCHDGTFEPEFRSVGSAYNSLVYAPVIANDPGNNFTYRVLPVIERTGTQKRLEKEKTELELEKQIFELQCAKAKREGVVGAGKHASEREFGAAP